MSSFIYPLTLLLTIIGKWKIFEDNNELGIKALIPFYSSYIFGKTFHEEELGKKLGISQAIFNLAAIPFVGILSIIIILFMTLTLSGGLGFMMTGTFWQGLYDNLSQPQRIILMILFIILVIAGIFVLVYHIKLHYRYTLYQKASPWFMVLWILLPCVAYIYFAFRNNNQTDI